AETHLTAVLAHEWSHIRRGDLRLLTLARWLLAVLFAHPLYWWLRGRMRADQEALADADAAGPGGAGDYAATPLHRVPPGRRRRGAEAALALWGRPSELKRRIIMLLNPQFPVETHCPGRWRLGAWSLTGVAVLALSVLTLRPMPQASAEEPPTQAPPAVKKEPPKTAPVPAKEMPKKGPVTSPKPPAPAVALELKVAGRVEDQDNKPVVGARVAVAAYASNGAPQVLGQTKTDAKGRFQLTVKKNDPSHQVVILAGAKGFGLGWHFVQSPAEALIRLQPEQIIRGRLIDLQGQAAAGVRVPVS